MLEVDEALRLVLEGTGPLGLESVRFTQSLGRVAGQDVAVTRPQPPFSNSAMDGYAVRASDLVGAPPFPLNVVAESAAGRRDRLVLGPKEAVRIFTGAPMPEGADAVIIQENVTNGAAQVNASVGENVRQTGVDLAAGTLIVKKGETLGPGEIANLATQGVLEPKVFRRPKVAVFSTGDELMPPGPEPGFGQITNSSVPMLAACLQTFGAEPIVEAPVRDNLSLIKEAILRAIQGADLLVVTGGMSVGDYDFAATAMRELGTVAFHKVRMKPGKPLAFGRIEDTPVLGLPGNPVSSFVGLELFARPMVRTLSGCQTLARPRTTQPLANGVRRNRSRPEYVRGRFEAGGFRTFPRQGSNDLSSLLAVEGLAVIDSGDEPMVAGDPVSIVDLRRHE